MTGYGNRYIGTFQDYYGNECEVIIMQKGYDAKVDKLVLASNPVVISKPIGDLHTRIFGTGCKINIVNTGEFLQYNDLFGTPEKIHYVKILGGISKSTILFEGFILPQMYTQSLRKKAFITLPANDQLSILREKKPEILRGENIYISIIDVIKDILWSTGLELPIFVKNGIYNKYYINSFDASTQAFDKTYIDKNLFLEDGEPEDSYSVLEKILKPFGCRVYYNNGKWVIDRLKNHTDLTSYKVYSTTDASVSSVSTPVFNLDNYPIVAESGNVQYEVGIKEYELTLNYNLFDNLINPYYKITRGRPLSIVGISYGRYWAIPLPKKYEWLDNVSPDASAIGNVVYYSTNYRDSNINYGVDWLAFPPSESTDVHPEFAAFSTKIVLDPIDSRPSKKVDLRVEYVATPVTPYNSDSTYTTRFALRARDEKASAAFRNVWLYINEDGSLAKTPSMTVARENFFEESLTGSELLSSSLKMNKFIPLDEVLDDIFEPEQPIELYLDFLLIKETRGSYSNHSRTRIGDFRISSALALQDNVFTANIDTDYNTTMKLDLDLFDTQSVQVKNALYFKDPCDNFLPTGSFEWSEVNYSARKSLQLVYLTDLIQNYSRNRYKFNLDVKLNNSLNLDGLYNYPLLLKDGSIVDMICTGYDLNVKENAYRLYVEEWTDDDGYYLKKYITPSDPQILTIAPSDVSILAFGGGGRVNVTSNTNWIVSTDYEWIKNYTKGGFENGYVDYYVEPLEGPLSRVGDIKIETYDSSIVRLFGIIQDSSLGEVEI